MLTDTSKKDLFWIFEHIGSLKVKNTQRHNISSSQLKIHLQSNSNYNSVV